MVIALLDQMQTLLTKKKREMVVVQMVRHLVAVVQEGSKKMVEVVVQMVSYLIAVVEMKPNEHQIENQKINLPHHLF